MPWDKPPCRHHSSPFMLNVLKFSIGALFGEATALAAFKDFVHFLVLRAAVFATETAIPFGLSGFEMDTCDTAVPPLKLSTCTSARLGAACSNPNNTGMTMAADAAALNNSFLPKFSLCDALAVIMRAILFFKSAPVTPDTQASENPAQN